jgi:gamma-aminobutyric acid receptor subunit alpha
MSAQISSILDTLFNNGYDRQIRPQLGQKPLEVTINLVIRSMGPVDEQKQTLSLDCYFRQYWRDTRLRYNNTHLNELPMNWQFLYKIWRPDTYIVNGKQSYLHKITVPNRFIRIAPDGMISYSQRLTVKARYDTQATMTYQELALMPSCILIIHVMH